MNKNIQKYCQKIELLRNRKKEIVSYYIKEQIKIKRRTNINFQLSEVMRSKLHKVLKNQTTSYKTILGCDFDFMMPELSRVAPISLKD